MDWQEAAIQHALKEAPKESCGLVVIEKGKAKYYPCNNLAETDQEFLLDPEDWAKCEDEGEIRYVVHSHPAGSEQPSMADKVCCERGDTEWAIVNPFKKKWAFYAPCGFTAPLVGREYVWGVTDCWSLCLDYYKEQGIELDDVVRRKNTREFIANPNVEESWESMKLRLIREDEQLQKGDILLIAINDTRPNHVALYLGDGQILHHLGGRLSSRDIYSSYYQKRTTRKLRYYDGSKSASD